MDGDEALVGRVAVGDEGALRMLLERYEGPLAHFIHRRTGGRDVDDLYQEVWMRVVRHAPRFDATRRFSTWLFQIAVNLCRDWLRRQQRTPIDARATAPEGAAEATGRIEASVDADRLMALLSDEQREVVALRYLADMPEGRIAEILGCPAGTVKSRLHAAMKRLSQAARADLQGGRT